jgi:hypothetical protein
LILVILKGQIANEDDDLTAKTLGLVILLEVLFGIFKKEKNSA